MKSASVLRLTASAVVLPPGRKRTPFGCYCFRRLPFGITSAPEHFQRRMSDLLRDLEGVVCMMDDVLVHGHTAEEHDERLVCALQRLEQAGLMLNKEKCKFSRPK